MSGDERAHDAKGTIEDGQVSRTTLGENAEAAEAHRILAARENVGKVVLVPQAEDLLDRAE